jgi:hypothetical protein
VTRPLNPQENLTLRALRESWPNRSYLDKPDPRDRKFAGWTDDERPKWRASTWEDVLEAIEHDVRGDVS